jgi:hypothetical protein
MNTTSVKMHAERRARRVSLTVSLYSGANVAHVSTPQDDQAMIQSHTIERRTTSQVDNEVASSPDPAVPSSAPHVRFELVQSPFRNGRIMKQKSGIISRAPAR